MVSCCCCCCCCCCQCHLMDPVGEDLCSWCYVLLVHVWGLPHGRHHVHIENRVELATVVAGVSSKGKKSGSPGARLLHNSMQQVLRAFQSWTNRQNVWWEYHSLIIILAFQLDYLVLLFFVLWYDCSAGHATWKLAHQEKCSSAMVFPAEQASFVYPRSQYWHKTKISCVQLGFDTPSQISLQNCIRDSIFQATCQQHVKP